MTGAHIAVNLTTEYISLIGLVQGLVLSALLILDRRMTPASRILGVICLLVALTFLVPFLLVNRDSGPIAAMIGPLFFLPVALGPLGYIYCRTALLGTSLERRDLLHLAPLGLCYALTADVSLADPQAMVGWIEGMRPPSIRLRIAEYLPVAIAYAYAVWTGWTIWQYRRQARANLSSFDPGVFHWLLGLQAFSLVVWSLKALPGPRSAPTLLVDLASLLLALFIYVIAIVQWRNPHFFTIPALSRARDAHAADEADLGALPREGELDPPIRAELFETVRRRLEDDRLYLDSGLTLERLAALTGLSRHHLSEVLNRHAGKNFYEVINGYRIDHVCRRLQQGTDQTVLDIALEAGFSSKSTFNAIFKRHTGTTPTRFRAAHAVS